jgi:hypothetical protein
VNSREIVILSDYLRPSDASPARWMARCMPEHLLHAAVKRLECFLDLDLPSPASRAPDHWRLALAFAQAELARRSAP